MIKLFVLLLLFSCGKNKSTSSNQIQNPIVESFSIQVQQDQVFSNFLKATQGSELFFKIVDYPKKGSLILNYTTGEFSYLPFSGLIGADSFSFVSVNAKGGI